MFSHFYDIYFSLESPYAILPSSQLCNHYDEQELTTLNECEIAAIKLNINPPTTEDSSFYPKGCYMHGSSGSNVYFNLHSTGSVHGSMRSICKISGEFLKPSSKHGILCEIKNKIKGILNKCYLSK